MRRLAAIAVVFALVLQSIMAPVARANAHEAAALQAALGVICTSDGEMQAPGDHPPAVHCELPCCLPGRAIAFDLPAAIVVAFVVLLAPAPVLAEPAPEFLNGVPARPPVPFIHRPRGPPAFA